MRYRCYAKINFTLEILGRRDDGFHDIASIVHTISLADDLRIEAADRLLTHVEGLDIDPDTNLVARAAALLQATHGERRGAELSLVKRIPAAAGLGGGSSDAATTLVGMNTLWGNAAKLGALAEVAARLGSDVPFFLRGGAALMSGRGERLQALPPVIGQWLVLLVPPHAVLDKTRRLYAALSPEDFSSGEMTLHLADHLGQGQPLDPTLCVNAFERAARAVFTGLGCTWDKAEQCCGRKFHLSGAGPALFAFAENRQDALRLARQVGEHARAVRTVKHARAHRSAAERDRLPRRNRLPCS